MQLESLKRSNVGDLGGPLNRTQTSLVGVPIYNEKLANLKMIVNNLLVELQEGKPLFYHIRNFSVEQIASNISNLTAASFNTKMAKLRGTAVLEHS